MSSRSSTSAEGWESPRQLLQRELFPRPRDELLASAHVSIEEMEDWRAFGWISFDVRDLTSFDDAQLSEMIFVRNIARAGLGRSQVTSLLGELEKPYSYDPKRVAYSFADGWVQLPRLPIKSERDEYMKDNLDEWIGRLAQSHDKTTLQHVYSAAFDAALELPSDESSEAEE
jgi:hypothetical protein